MAIISPFRAVRYNPERVPDLEAVVTPPYDVIDAQAQAALVAKNPYNMIQLDLGKSGGAGDAARYQEAATRYRRWLEEGVLLRDTEPAIYLYHIDYRLPSGEVRTRKGFIALVRLADFASGVVKPHEKTFVGVTDDRLELLRTTGVQFSQVFSLYSDPQARAMTALEQARPAAALAEVTDADGCVHRLWRVTDAAAIAAVTGALAASPLYIADGHHRYTTALRLRDLERQRRPDMADDDPYNQVAMYLCPMEDPGLTVLPTHRLVRLPAGGMTADHLAGICRKCFQVEELGAGGREGLVAQALDRIDEYRGGGTVLGLYHPGEDRCFFLRLEQKACQAAETLDAMPEALRRLDVVVLHHLVLGTLLGLDHQQLEADHLVEYYSDPDIALDAAVKEANTDNGHTPVLFLMHATGVDQVRHVADQGLYMPHKSTYFYPKILTGLVLRPLE